MPEIVFSEEELDRIVEIMREYDPATHGLLADFKDRMPSEDWDFVCKVTLVQMKAYLIADAVLDGAASKIAEIVWPPPDKEELDRLRFYEHLFELVMSAGVDGNRLCEIEQRFACGPDPRYGSFTRAYFREHPDGTSEELDAAMLAAGINPDPVEDPLFDAREALIDLGRRAMHGGLEAELVDL